MWLPIGPLAHFGVIATLGAMVLFAYANTLHNMGFALDNKFLILEDPRLRTFALSDPVEWETTKSNINLIFKQDYWYPKTVSGLWRPLTTTSYLFNYSVLQNGIDSTGYHWVNFLLQWAVTALVFYLVLVVMNNLWAALFAAAIFAVHPVGTETVTNLIGRADQLAALGVLSGFLFYAKSTFVHGWRKLPWLFGLMLATAFGLLCKESAVVILGVMVLYDVTFRLKKLHTNGLLSVLLNFRNFILQGYWAVLPAFLTFWPGWPHEGFVRAKVFAQLRPPELPFVDNPLVEANIWVAKLSAIKVMGKYIWLMVMPVSLSCDYSYNQIPLVDWSFGFEDWKAFAALVVVVGLIVLAVYNYRQTPPAFFFIMFFFITLLPTANLFNLVGSIMAERFLYLPLAGFAGCLVLAVYWLMRRLIQRLTIPVWAHRIWLLVAARTLLVLIIGTFIFRTCVRNFDWEDDITLWSSAVVTSPKSFKTHKSLAFSIYEKDPEYKNIDRVIEEAEKALEITTRNQIVHLHLGAYYRIKADTLAQKAPNGQIIPTTQSLPYYQKSVDVLAKAVPLDRAANEENRKKEIARGRKPEEIADVGNFEIYWNLGISYMRLGKTEEAYAAFKEMRHLAPANPDAYLSIASVFLATGRLNDATIPLLQALLLDNNRQEALRSLIDIYRQIDRQGCAIVTTTGTPALNRDCPLVHDHICKAYAGLIQNFLDAKLTDLAQQTKKGALETYKCDPAPINKLMPEKAFRLAIPE